MLTKEEIFYLQVIKDYLHGEKTNEVKDLDYQKLNALAMSQNTNGIVFNQCKDFIPKEYYQSFMNLYFSELFVYGQRINSKKEIINKLKEKDIPYFLVKGLELSKYYPIPALRTMGDIDIEIKKEYLDEAYKIVEELGYKLVKKSSERCYFKNNLEIEIHHQLLYDNDANKNEEINFFKDMWDHVKDNELDPSYHFIFLIFHLKKHILQKGCGIRQFIDLALMATKENLDWDYINSSLEKFDLLRFKDICMALNYKWFNIKAQDKIIDIDDDVFEEKTAELLKNGVHGDDNKDNEIKETTLPLYQYRNQNKFVQRFKYMINRYFPRYENMVKISHYSFLKDKKYLLPIAWIYRFILSIKYHHASKEIIKSLKVVSLDDDINNKEINSLSRWGL